MEVEVFLVVGVVFVVVVLISLSYCNLLHLDVLVDVYDASMDVIWILGKMHVQNLMYRTYFKLYVVQ